VRLDEPLSRCGSHSSASKGVHFLGGIQPHLPRSFQKCPNPIFRGWFGWQAHLSNQVSSIINHIFIYYDITPGRVKKGCARGGSRRKLKFPGSHAHIFHPVSTLIFINLYKQTTENFSAQSVQIWGSDFRTVMHQLEPPSVCRASLRLPSLAGKIRHPIYSPLLIFMALANPVLFVLCVATRRTRPRLRKDSD